MINTKGESASYLVPVLSALGEAEPIRIADLLGDYPDELRQYRQYVRALLVETSLQHNIVAHAHDLMIRELSASDLGRTDWDAGPLVAMTKKTHISHQLHIDQIIAVIGLYVPKPASTLTRCWMGPGSFDVDLPRYLLSTRGLYSLNCLSAFRTPVGLLVSAVMFHPSETMTVMIESGVGARDEQLGLLGFICEPIGVSISRREHFPV